VNKSKSKLSNKRERDQFRLDVTERNVHDVILKRDKIHVSCNCIHINWR